MPIDSSKFRSNSLTGAVKVSGGHANIALPTAFYALEGNVSFNILVRTGSVEGPVIYTSPAVTLRDNSSFVSLTANTATVNEGDLVAFTLVTANALGNSTLYYSVLPATANVTSSDFVANTGLFYLTNNAGTFTLKANADLSLMNETGENFRVQLRTVSATGNVVYATSNIAIQDTSNAYNIISLAPASSTAIESSNITFTFTATNVPFGTVFYYETTGNATVTANTGSFVLNSISNTFTISAGDVPANATRAFTVNLRTGSAAGQIVATSSTAYVVDSALAYMFATGGNEVYNHSGYRIHRFYSANTLTITRAGSGGAFSTIEYMVVGGGGSGGAVIQAPPLAGGGGGAGGMAYGNISVTSQPITVVVGSGGAANPGFTGEPGSNSYITSPDIAGQIIGLGGGKGGWAGEGAPGGSGGGGAQFFFSPTPGGSAIPFTVTGGTHYGNPGANGPPSASGGGGGAGGAGSAGSGGSGRTTTITGAATTWAAGGGAPQGPSGTINTGNGGGGGPQPSGAPGGGSGIVVLRYPYVEPPTYTSLIPSSTFAYEGGSAVFTLNTLNLANNTLLYYTTVGNVISSDFVSGNTGSFRSTANTTTITLTSNTNIPSLEERYFQLQVRADGLTDPVVATSNVFTIKDTALAPPSLAAILYEGTNKYLYNEGVAVDSSKNMFMVSFTNASGNGQTLISKFNPSGVLQWQKYFGNSASDISQAIATDSSGNVYVGLFSYESGNADFVIAKFDTNGNILWQRTIGDSGSNDLRGITVDLSGNVYACGGAAQGGLVVKYDTNGTLQWQRIYGTDTSTLPKAIKTDSTGNVYVTGGCNDAVMTTLKYNSSGTVLWQRTIGTTNAQLGMGLAVDSSDNLYVKVEDSGSPYQMGLVKYDPNGNVQWQRSINSASTEHGWCVATDSSGVYVMGTSEIINSTTQPIILKYDFNGTLQWQRYLASNVSLGISTGACLVVDTNADRLILGLTLTRNDPASMIFKLPTDGTKTGNISINGYNIIYGTTSAMTSATSSYSTGTGNRSTSTPTLTSSTSSLAVSNSSMLTSVTLL